MTNETIAQGCARVQARVHVLVDGALPPLEEARDRGHLEACAACRGALASHERLLRTIRAASAVDVALDVALVNDALLVELAALRPVRPASRPRSAPAALVAAAAAVLLVAWLVFRGAGLGPRALELTGFDPLLEHLPSWSEVAGGLGRFSRWIS